MDIVSARRRDCVGRRTVYGMVPASMPAEQVSQFGGTSPTGRPAQPAELAPAFVFLASQESSYVNGEILGVTGGQPLP